MIEKKKKTKSKTIDHIEWFNAKVNIFLIKVDMKTYFTTPHNASNCFSNFVLFFFLPHSLSFIIETKF